jgi:hypothetical protein
MPDPHLRASDADRAEVADVLGAHMSAGRLTVAEYDERLTRAYASKTYGELAELTADLPSSTPRPADPAAAGTGAHSATGGRESAPVGAEQGPVGFPAGQPCGRDRQRNRRSGRLAHGGAPWGPHWGASGPWTAGSLRVVWGSWLSTALVVITIWAATSLASGDWLYFWPVWVIGPWGAVLLARTLTGDHRDDRQLEGRAR